MKITEKEVRYVADLANLSLSDAEVVQLRADLDGILGHMDKLKEIGPPTPICTPTSGIEPQVKRGKRPWGSSRRHA